MAGVTPPGRSLDRPLAPLPAPFAAKAKRCIFLFMYGGPSQMDLFDYKPELQKRHGQTVNVEVRRDLVVPQTLLASKRQFAKHGAVGPVVFRRASLPRQANGQAGRHQIAGDGFLRTCFGPDSDEFGPRAAGTSLSRRRG